MSFESVLYEVNGSIAIITMNRPEVRNAQNVQMIEEMDQAFKMAELDKNVNAIILAGSGSSFSSGHDLKMDENDPNAFVRSPNIEHKWQYEREIFFEKVLRTWRMRKPVIAQVQGYCLGAGFMVANMCDFIIASEDAQFGDPVTRMGAAAVEVLCHPWVLPPRIAKELLMTGRNIDAETAARYGMVNKVVKREQLEAQTMEFAEQIAKMPPFAISMIKHSINRTVEMMGFYHAINAHFDTHILSHWTDETYARLYEGRTKSKNMKEFFNNRDKDFESG